MSVYPLQSVLDLKRREEEALAARLADATRRRAAAEQEEHRHLTDVQSARVRLRQAHGGELPGASETDAESEPRQTIAIAGNAVASAALFVERRRRELEAALATLAEFRRGALAAARRHESAAKDEHMAARRARETFEKHAERHRATQRAAARHREEETLEDATRRPISVARRDPGD